MKAGKNVRIKQMPGDAAGVTKTMARVRTEEEKQQARIASKEAEKQKWMDAQEEKRAVHNKYMKEAIRQAQKAAALGEVPIGCVIVHDGKIIGRGYNRRNTDKSTLAHAEISAIKKASRALADWRLEECTLYVTLEPCQMCAGPSCRPEYRR